MKTLKPLLLSILLGLAAAQPVQAGDSDPFFLNLTTDDGHRSSMAVGFGAKQQARGHALTLFLNDRGVMVASRGNAERFSEQQQVIVEILAKGGSVYVCPMCLKHYGMKASDLIPGVQLGNPELVGAALFKDNSKALTW